jgi:hypothetical protein
MDFLDALEGHLALEFFIARQQDFPQPSPGVKTQGAIAGGLPSACRRRALCAPLRSRTTRKKTWTALRLSPACSVRRPGRSYRSPPHRGAGVLGKCATDQWRWARTWRPSRRRILARNASVIPRRAGVRLQPESPPHREVLPHRPQPTGIRAARSFP